jgi:hypothetical protein
MKKKPKSITTATAELTNQIKKKPKLNEKKNPKSISHAPRRQTKNPSHPAPKNLENHLKFRQIKPTVIVELTNQIKKPPKSITHDIL